MSAAAALALGLAFGALGAGRIGPLLSLCTLQALAAAIAAGGQGVVRHEAALCLAAVLAFALNGVALPLACHRRVGRASVSLAIRWRCGFVVSAAAAFVLAAASVAVVAPLATGVRFDTLACGLSILLLGLLLVAIRSHRLLPALGLLSSQNGLVLAASVIPGLPPEALLLAVVPIVPALLLMRMWLHGRNRLTLVLP